MTTYLWILNGKVIVYMVTQDRIGSPEAAVIYFASITYKKKKKKKKKKKITNQTLSITAIFVSSCNGKERCVPNKTPAWGTNSLQTQPIIVTSRKVPPPLPAPHHKGAREALRDETKNCCTKVHEYSTNMPT